MSNRAHLSRLIQDAAGNVLDNIQVTVYDVGTEDLITETMFVDDTSSSELENPFTVTDGTVNFYLTHPKRVRFQVQAEGQIPQFYDDIDVPSPASFVDTVRLRATDGTTFWNLTVTPTGQLVLTNDDASVTKTFTGA